jgi:hypothetical protein
MLLKLKDIFGSFLIVTVIMIMWIITDSIKGLLK